MAASEAIQKISRLTPLADVQLMIDAEVKAVTSAQSMCLRVWVARLQSTHWHRAVLPLGARTAGWLGGQRRRNSWSRRLRAIAACAHAIAYRGRTAAAGGNRQCCADRHSESRRRPCGGAHSVLPGDGVLPAGGDSDPAILVPARRRTIALPLILPHFPSSCIARITVREPRIRVIPVRGSGIINAAARLVTAQHRPPRRRRTIGTTAAGAWCRHGCRKRGCNCRNRRDRQRA